MGFIMGESKFFSNFLSGLSHQGLPWGHIWACTPTIGNLGTFEIPNFRGKIREHFFSLIMEFNMGGSKFSSKF